MRTFVTKCIVGEFVTEGSGNGKKVGSLGESDRRLLTTALDEDQSY